MRDEKDALNSEVATLTAKNSNLTDKVDALTTSNEVVCRAYCRRELLVVIGLAGERYYKGGRSESRSTGCTKMFDFAQSLVGRIGVRKLAKVRERQGHGMRA